MKSHTYIYTRDAAIKLEDAQAGVATTPQLVSNDGLDAGGEGGALSLGARNECSMVGSRGGPKGKVTVVWDQKRWTQEGHLRSVFICG